MQLIHSGMTQQQRSDLLSALVSLESEDDNIANTNVSQQAVCDSGATSDCGGAATDSTSGSGNNSVKSEISVTPSNNNETSSNITNTSTS